MPLRSGMPASDEQLVRQRVGRVELVMMNRPEQLNALNLGLDKALSSAFTELADDDEVDVVVLTGAGTRAFCAGADLTDLSHRGTLREPHSGLSVVPMMRHRFVKPVVAAVNGLAFGGGCELALWSDLIVSVEHARFALPEIRWGLLAAAGGIIRSGSQLPPSMARSLLLSAEPISASRAYAVGMIHQLVPQDELMDRALDLAAKIASHPSTAVKATRDVLNELERAVTATAWTVNDRGLEQVLAASDLEERVTAFQRRQSERSNP